ncbi:hypothetical protein BH11PSE4_BH11PSE4_06840 [soil metagenome]
MATLDTLLNGMTDTNPDGWIGLTLSALAGAATAVAVAIALSIYFSRGYRSRRDLMQHGFGMIVVLGLTAFAVSDVRATALTYLGIIASKPAVEFEIRLPDAVAAKVDTSATQIELHTDRNQALANLHAGPSFTSTGVSILRGSVPLKFRTSHRVVILTLPGQSPLAFKLRLAPSPSQTAEFGPWHLADSGVTGAGATSDIYAIRYRVI